MIVKKTELEKDKQHYYTKVSNQAMEYACQVLNEYGIKLWLYLSQNEKDFELAFSPQALIKWAGGSDKSWRNARDILIKERFLVPLKNNNEYEFLEYPPSIQEIWSYEIARDDIEWMDGDLVRLKSGELKKIKSF